MDLTFDSCLLSPTPAPADSSGTAIPPGVPSRIPTHKLFNPQSYVRSHLPVGAPPPVASEDRGNGMASSTAVMDAEFRAICARTIGERWADALRKRYPANTLKRVMTDFNAAEGTVKGWLSGQPPQQRHVARAINLHGPGIAGEMYAPGSGWSREEALKAKLAATRAALKMAMQALEELA